MFQKSVYIFFFIKIQGVLLQQCFLFKQVFPKTFPGMRDIPVSALLMMLFQIINVIPADTPYGGEWP